MSDAGAMLCDQHVGDLAGRADGETVGVTGRPGAHIRTERSRYDDEMTPV